LNPSRSKVESSRKLCEVDLHEKPRYSDSQILSIINQGECSGTVGVQSGNYMSGWKVCMGFVS